MLLCFLFSTTNTCELKPSLGLGHIQTYEGKVILVSHTIDVVIDHSDTIEIPEILLELGEQIKLVSNQLKVIQNITIDLNLKVIPELLNLLNITSNKIKGTLSFFPDKRLHNRAERGLLNIIGIGLSYLFGVASSEDLEKLNKRFVTLDELQNSQNLLLDKLVAQSNSHYNKINELIGNINDIGKQLTNISELMQINFELDYLMVYTNNMHKEIDTCLNEIKHHLDNIVLASKGIITTNIISLEDLSIVLNTAKIEHNLDPIFSTNQLSFYYNIMNVLIAPKALIIQIPMSSNYVFNHFRFIPFPTYNHNETLILNINKTDLLVSLDNKFYTEATKDQFSVCQHGERLLICPSNVLPLYNVLQGTSCLSTLLAKDSLPSGCSAHSVASTTKVEIVHPYVFITRKLPTRARLTCPDGSRIITSRTFVFREVCTLEDKNILIVGHTSTSYSLQHHKDKYIHDFEPSNLTRGKWRIIRRIKKPTDVNFLHTSSVRIIIPSTATVIGLIALLLFIYCVYSKWNKPQRSSPDEPEVPDRILHVPMPL